MTIKNGNRYELVGNKRVHLDICEECKYTASREAIENCKEVDYEEVDWFEVVSGAEAEEIEAQTDGSCIDDYHEYLVLHFGNGDTATFRNSYVDLFNF